MPASLDLVHRALAERRRLRIFHDGKEKEIEPGRLTVANGRWFVLARFVGSDQFYGWRLDRLEVEGLGVPITTPLDPPDPIEVVDNTAWRRHEPVDVELRCSADDAEWVVSWFARATASYDEDELVMHLQVRNMEALVDRVLRFAGAVWATAPPDIVARVREHAAAF